MLSSLIPSQLRDDLDITVFDEFNNDTSEEICGLRVRELHRLKGKWRMLNVDKRPGNLNTLDALDSALYPNIFLTLSILATMAVSTTTTQTSFSTLRRVKTWLRSTMTQE